MVNYKGQTTVNKWVSIAQTALYPPRCRLCGDPGAEGLDLCAPCRAELPWNVPRCPRCALPTGDDGGCPCRARALPFSRAVVPLRYEGEVQALVGAFKFHGRLADGQLLGGLLARALRQEAGSPLPEVIVPVPLHARRLRQRGFDQTAELARALRRQLAPLPLRRALGRHRGGARQAGLPAQARLGNIRGAFTAQPRRTPRHAALLDDVVTTGATAEEAAWQLLAAGAERVDLWAVARTPA